MPDNMIKRRTLLRTMAAAPALALSSGWAGQAMAQDSDPVKFLLDWTWWPPQIPLMVAREKGFFGDAGLDVEFRQGQGSSSTAQTVAQGTYDMGHVNLTTAAQNIAKDVPIKSVATIAPKGASALVFKAGKINSVEDLKGKKIGSTAAGSDAQILPAFLEKNDIAMSDVQIVNLPGDAKLGALLSDQIDVVSGDGYYYQALAAERGIELDQLVFGDYQANSIGYGLIANEEFIANHPDRIKRFVAAALKGYEYTDANIDEAIDIYKDVSQTGQADETVRKVLTGFLDLIKSGPDAENPYSGRNEPEVWRSTIDILTRFGGLESEKDQQEYWTNELLP